MTGADLRHIRHRLGRSVIQFGRALGYRGNENSISVDVRRLEAPNGRQIRLTIERLALMFDRFGIPDGWDE